MRRRGRAAHALCSSILYPLCWIEARILSLRTRSLMVKGPTSMIQRLWPLQNPRRDWNSWYLAGVVFVIVTRSSPISRQVAMVRWACGVCTNGLDSLIPMANGYQRSIDTWKGFIASLWWKMWQGFGEERVVDSRIPLAWYLSSLLIDTPFTVLLQSLINKWNVRTVWGNGHFWAGKLDDRRRNPH